MINQIRITICNGHGLAIRLMALAFALALTMFVPTAETEAACTVPNQITNGQVADATAVMGNFNALNNCVNSTVSLSGSPVTGSLPVFSSPSAVTSGNLSGDCTTAGTLAVTCTGTNGSPFGYFATGTDAAQLTGTISVSQFNNGVNADSTHFLRGDGVWATPPAGGGTGSGQLWYLAYRPLAADFTIVSGDATSPILADDNDEGLQFDLGSVVTGDKWRGAEKVIAAPTADWTVTAKVEALTPDIGYRGAGLYIRDSVGGRIISLYRYRGDSLDISRWGSLSGTWNSRIIEVPNVGNHTGWFRISYTAADNTYRFYYSLTGRRWTLLAAELQATYLANRADRIGFGGWSNSSSGPNTIGAVQYWLQSW